jgi:hypothetical protein
MSRKSVPDYLLVWTDARKKFHLSHEQVQMARELGLNPKKLGKLANHKQEPWKMPLPQFIEHLYRKQFGKNHPVTLMSIEEKVELEHCKKLARRAKKQAASAQIQGEIDERVPVL